MGGGKWERKGEKKRKIFKNLKNLKYIKMSTSTPIVSGKMIGVHVSNLRHKLVG